MSTNSGGEGSAAREHLEALRFSGVDSLPITEPETQAIKAKIARKRAVSASASSSPKVVSNVTVPVPVKTPGISKACVARVIPQVRALDVPEGDKAAQWAWLRRRVLEDAVVLSHVREGVQPVFGVGCLDSPIFFCGEAPGADEERQGEPFVGRAGQLLTKIIQAMGLQRSDVYIANILNWRPEKEDMAAGNRPPTVEEMLLCLPFLKAQVKIVKPKVIVALGATAVTGLLGPDPERRMTTARGNFFDFDGTPVMVTYHPSYLLRNNTNAAKRQVWEDMLLVMRKVGMPISVAQEGYFL